jgi:hypothetical protein
MYRLDTTTFEITPYMRGSFERRTPSKRAITGRQSRISASRRARRRDSTPQAPSGSPTVRAPAHRIAPVGSACAQSRRGEASAALGERRIGMRMASHPSVGRACARVEGLARSSVRQAAACWKAQHRGTIACGSPLHQTGLAQLAIQRSMPVRGRGDAGALERGLKGPARVAQVAVMEWPSSASNSLIWLVSSDSSASPPGDALLSADSRATTRWAPSP